MWWTDVERLVDEDDVIGVKADDAHVVAEAQFRDSFDERPTEYTVLLRMLRRALSRVPDELTERQNEAVKYALLAAQTGVSPTRLVADTLGISRKSARKLLNRADTRLRMASFDEKSTDICVERHVSNWQPSEQQVRQKMTTLRKRCAGGVEGCRTEIPGRYDLCPVCLKYFGSFAEWPGWLVLEVRRIRQQHRRDATRALYEVRSLDEMNDGDY